MIVKSPWWDDLLIFFAMVSARPFPANSAGLDLTHHSPSQLATTAGGIVFILREFGPPNPNEVRSAELTLF